MPGGRPSGKTQTDSVKSVAKVLDILEYLGDQRGPVSVSDLARATGLNVSTAFRLLQTLVARGYAEQQRSSRGYQLGARFFLMGTAYLQGKDLAEIARPHLEDLRDLVGETAYLVIFSQGEIVQLCKADGKQAVSASVRPMVREPAYCTATGKVLLASLTERQLDDYLAGVTMQAFTARTITEEARLREEIAKVRESGYALDMEEFVPSLSCLSVPVRAAGDPAKVVAAISIAMPSMRFRQEAVAGWCGQLREKADRIAQQLAMIET